MDDYIKREDALAFQDNLDPVAVVNTHMKGIYAAVKAYDLVVYLNAIPAADVRPVVKAEWLPIIDANEDGSPYQSGVHCSACGHCEVYEYNFCPNCGAMMEVDE